MSTQIYSLQLHVNLSFHITRYLTQWYRRSDSQIFGNIHQLGSFRGNTVKSQTDCYNGRNARVSKSSSRQSCIFLQSLAQFSPFHEYHFLYCQVRKKIKVEVRLMRFINGEVGAPLPFMFTPAESGKLKTNPQLHRTCRIFSNFLHIFELHR